MTTVLESGVVTAPDVAAADRVSVRTVRTRRVFAMLMVLAPLGWALHRALADAGPHVNGGGWEWLRRLVASIFTPELDPSFLGLVARAAVVTVTFAVLGTALALVFGAIGGVVLSQVVSAQRGPLPLRLVRLAVQGILVALRSVHELVWGLLLVAVLALDPLVAVLAIAIPFGAQSAKVFADIIDTVPRAAYLALTRAGAPRLSALSYGLVPGALPLLWSYSTYRFECALRSAIVLGVVGVGGLGQELVLSLQSRNWAEVWTLVWAVVLLAGVVDWVSGRARTERRAPTCAQLPGDRVRVISSGRRRVRGWLLVGALLLACVVGSGVRLDGLFSERTRTQAARLGADLWPPQVPGGSWSSLGSAALDTVAMAVLAMALAVAITALLAPGAASRGRLVRVPSRVSLLLLRSMPPTVWAVLCLFVLFPGILPGALALGLYTAGILGRLVAQAWESIDRAPQVALERAGVPPLLASAVSVLPASVQHLVFYSLYRFEICVRDTAVVGIVGAAGLGGILSERLAVFDYGSVTTVLAALFLLSLGSEIVGRRVRSWLAAG